MRFCLILFALIVSTPAWAQHQVWLGGISYNHEGRHSVPTGIGTICHSDPMPPGAGVDPEECWFEETDQEPWIGGTLCTYPQGTCAFAGSGLPLVNASIPNATHQVRAFPEPGCYFVRWEHGPTALQIPAYAGHIYQAIFQCNSGGGFMWPY